MAIIAKVSGGTRSGGARLVARLDLRLNPNFKAEATKAGLDLMPQIVQQIQAAIVRRSPFRFGTNRRSVRSTRLTDKKSYAIFSTSGYGGYLEFGHRTRSGRFVAARPYFRLGAEYMAGQISKLRDAKQLASPLPDPGRPIMRGPAQKAV